MGLPSIDDLEVSGRTVLVRSDLNVPLKDGAVADDSRIRAAAPTIRTILDRGGRAVVISHLGRPRGERDEALSLRPVAEALSGALDGREVAFATDCTGPEAENVVSGLRDGECALLENLRFDAGEKANDPAFADALAGLADLYVNDAFSAAHRAHASIVGVAERLPSAAGSLMQTELASLERLLAEPKRPYAAILGGAKVETKIGVIEALLDRADRIMLGGVMGNTFLKARGVTVGRSKTGDEVDAAERLLQKAGDGARLMLPVDAVVARDTSPKAETAVVEVTSIGPDMMVLDIGPETIRTWLDVLGEDGTVVWNGPLGMVEQARFQRGTHQVAAAVGERTTTARLTSIVGGGDTVAFLHEHQLWDMFTYTSLAGGAFLQWLAGAPLPGVEALKRQGQQNDAPRRRQ